MVDPEESPLLQASIRHLLQGISAELRRHGQHLARSSHWHTDHIHRWEWLWDAWGFECKVPAGDSYRLFTVRIDLPAVGRPLRAHCNCRLPPRQGTVPFPHHERCAHTYAGLRFLYSQLSTPFYGAQDRRVHEMLTSPAVAAWSSTVSVLDGFLAEHESAAPEIDRTRRLTWRLRSRPYGPELGAWEQKARSGVWTQGQKVVWERLVRDRALWTTEADRRAVTRIFEDRMSSQYPGTFWHIDAIAALRDLVGHPLVFRWDDPQQPVAIEAAELALGLREAPSAPPESTRGLGLEITLGG